MYTVQQVSVRYFCDYFFSWKVMGECSAKCNETGHRDVRCQKELLDSMRSEFNMTFIFVSAEHCRHLGYPPAATVNCIGPCLSTRWAYTSWSEVQQTIAREKETLYKCLKHRRRLRGGLCGRSSIIGSVRSE